MIIAGRLTAVLEYIFSFSRGPENSSVRYYIGDSSFTTLTSRAQASLLLLRVNHTIILAVLGFFTMIRWYLYTTRIALNHASFVIYNVGSNGLYPYIGLSADTTSTG